MALEALYGQIVPMETNSSERPPSRRRLRDDGASASVSKDDALTGERKLIAIHDAQLRQLIAVVEDAWKVPASASVASCAMQALAGWKKVDPGRGKKHENGAAHVAVATGFLMGLFAKLPEASVLKMDEQQHKVLAKDFEEFKGNMNAVVAAGALAGQVTSAIAKPTKKDPHVTLLKVMWTFHALPRKYSYLIDVLMKAQGADKLDGPQPKGVLVRELEATLPGRARSGGA